MRVGRRLGLQCGHFTEKEEMAIEDDIAPIQYWNFLAPWLGEWTAYCSKCNDAKKIIRVNAFLIEKETGEIA